MTIVGLWKSAGGSYVGTPPSLALSEVEGLSGRESLDGFRQGGQLFAPAHPQP
jgi:hypothetical protein